MKSFKNYLKENTEEHLGFHDHNARVKNSDDSEPWVKHFNNNPGLEHHEMHSLRVYSGTIDNDIGTEHKDTAYRAINNQLRNSGSTEDSLKDIKVSDHIKNIDSVLSKHTTMKPATVWRGLAGLSNTHEVPNQLNAMKPGDTFHDKGFVSTTVEPYTADSFSRTYHKNPNDITKMERHFAKIHIPKGSKALYLNSHKRDLGIGYEHEVLLPRGSKFRYEGKTVHPTSLHGYQNYDEDHIHHLTYLGDK
jgi:hypothetical protein